MHAPFPEGATPLDPDETEGLRLAHVSTRGELDEAEGENIAEALVWATTSRRGRADPLSESFVFELHRRMFGRVWSWAGQVRLTEKNIGIHPWEVRPAVRDLVEDARLWRGAPGRGVPVYPLIEIAVRFHHRLVWIHPFANGNGRHARMMADLLLRHAGSAPLPWGQHSGSGLSTDVLRRRYLEALRAADRGEYAQLLEFATS